MAMFGNAMARQRGPYAFAADPIRQAGMVPGMAPNLPAGLPQMGGMGGQGPGFADSTFGAAPFAQPQDSFIPQPSAMEPALGATIAGQMPAAKKPGFFDRDGMGLNLLGGLSDGVLAVNGMAPVFGPAVQRRQERQERRTDLAASRQQQIATWIAQQRYTAEHPPAVAPSNAQKEYEFYSRLRDTGKISPDQFNAWQAGQLNPLTWLRGENGDGSVTMSPVPKGGMPGASAPQPAPAGVTFTPLPAAGGASPSGSRTFP